MSANRATKSSLLVTGMLAGSVGLAACATASDSAQVKENPSANTAAATPEQTFGCTKTIGAYVVSGNETKLTIQAQGGSGGVHQDDRLNVSKGGLGNKMTIPGLPIKPLDKISYAVGCVGRTTNSADTTNNGGWPNGAAGGHAQHGGNNGSGGGGASFVWINNQLVVVAAGGGGTDYDGDAGGSGSYETGGDGASPVAGCGGRGGSQTAAGAGGVGGRGGQGGSGPVGAGLLPTQLDQNSGRGGVGNYSKSKNDVGGGGGGGWTGGGGGCASDDNNTINGAGGGGASWFNTTMSRNEQSSAPSGRGDGFVTLTFSS